MMNSVEQLPGSCLYKIGCDALGKKEIFRIIAFWNHRILSRGSLSLLSLPSLFTVWHPLQVRPLTCMV